MDNFSRSLEVPELSRSDFFGAKIAWPTINSAAAVLADAGSIGCIDLSKVRHMRPYQVAIAAALAEDHHIRGRPLGYQPPDDDSVREHLERLGLPGIVLQQPGDPATTRSTNLPIQVLRGRATESFGWDTTEALIRELEFDLAAGLQASIAEGINEMVLNAASHSDSAIGCVVVGQAFPKTRVLELAILDLGITIRGHLSSHAYPNLTDDAKAIELALTDGVTGTPKGSRNKFGEPNAGQGLASLHTFLAASGGDLSILSGSAIVCRNGQRGQKVHRLRCPPL